MKKLLVIILLLPFCKLQAQSELLSKGNTWNVVNYINGVAGFSCIDTTTVYIGESVMKKALQYSEILLDNSVLLGHMRQEGMKYYFNPKDSELDFLLYDFSVVVGDVVNVVSEEYCEFATEIKYNCSVVVTQIDTFIDKQGNERKKITLNNHDVWIEGIGSLRGFIQSCSNYDMGGEGTWLLSFAENDTQLYKVDCPCNFSSAIEDYSFISSISPNPVKDILHITLPTANNLIQIIDAQGRKVLQTECGETATINVSQLKNGVYTIIVNNKQSQTFVKE